MWHATADQMVPAMAARLKAENWSTESATCKHPAPHGLPRLAQLLAQHVQLLQASTGCSSDVLCKYLHRELRGVQHLWEVCHDGAQQQGAQLLERGQAASWPRS